MLSLEMAPHRISIFLAINILCLSVAHCLSGLYMYVSGSKVMPWFAALFHFEHEHNIPTLYAAGTLLLSSFLLLYISRFYSGKSRHFWLGLSCLFLFVAIDEFCVIHENLIPIFRNRLNTSGLLYFAWVIPYGCATLVIGSIYLKFLLSLPSRTRYLFFLSAVIYLSGALGLELVGGFFYETSGSHTLIYQAITSSEELLEMIGVLTFIHALTSHIAYGIPYKSFQENLGTSGTLAEGKPG